MSYTHPSAHCPELSNRGRNDPWPSGELQAHQILTKAYHEAFSLLHFENGHPICLQLHANRIIKWIVFILQALKREITDHAWLGECAQALASLVCELDDAAVKAKSV